MDKIEVTQAIEWARKVASSKPPRYTDASRNAAQYILATRTDATPVAWMYELPEENVRKFYQTRFPIKVPGWTEVPLYPHPPATDVAALVEALKDVSRRIKDSDNWWIDCPDRGGFDALMIDAALAPFTKGQNDD